MKLKSLLQRVKNRLQPQPELTDEIVVKFLKVLEQARSEELSCSDIYARLDEFVEKEIRDPGEMEKITPLIREHLDLCPECNEEYEALLSVLENTKEK